MHSLQHVLGQKLKKKKNTDLRMNFDDCVKAKAAFQRCQLVPSCILHAFVQSETLLGYLAL